MSQSTKSTKKIKELEAYGRRLEKLEKENEIVWEGQYCYITFSEVSQIYELIFMSGGSCYAIGTGTSLEQTQRTAKKVDKNPKNGEKSR